MSAYFQGPYYGLLADYTLINDGIASIVMGESDRTVVTGPAA